LTLASGATALGSVIINSLDQLHLKAKYFLPLVETAAEVMILAKTDARPDVSALWPTSMQDQ
jgi:hypothetical protein